jgi:hypothetical protein
VLTLHSIYYYHLILTMFEPLLDVNTLRTPSTRDVVAEAKKHLQTVVRLYYLRHGFDAMDLFIVIPLMLTGYDCIDSITDRTPEAELDALRSTLVLVAQGLYEQRRNHHLAKALFRVIWGRMRPQEAALLTDRIMLEDNVFNPGKDLEQGVRSHWPVSVVKKMEEIDAHTLTNLVQSYGHLNIDAPTSRD